MYEQITREAEQALEEFLLKTRLAAGDIFVVGCSSSEILGHPIGKGSSMDAAKAVFRGLYPILSAKGIYLAAQCCEHLNRAIIIERNALSKDTEIVNVIPQPKAGGSFATVAWSSLADPVAVEEIRADAGMDIGGTLIGMHLKRVAVPVRLNAVKIGEASVLSARTRPKYIGGERSIYQQDAASLE